MLTRSARPIALVSSLVAVLALLLTACSSSGSGGSGPSASSSGTPGSSSSSAPSSSAAPSSSKPAVPTTKVHVMILESDGAQFGVGMPEIAYFSKQIKNAAAIQKATTVTVNGKPAHGAWYFETSAAHKGYPIEGHFRLQHYWPRDSKIFIKMPFKGLSAGIHDGRKYVIDDSLTSSWSTGASHIATVDDSTHRLTLTVNGHTEGSYPVSLGASNTPTRRGIKVIMEKGLSICMSGPGYDECGIKDTQRLTYDGEYLHSAPWNISHIESGIDSSNGCTNLLPADADKLYHILEIGDVVIYPNANGPEMQLGNGYGDWNVPWTTWLTGGLVPTR